jgi:hypothetical protein
MFVATNITRICVTGQKSLYVSIGIAVVLGWREWFCLLGVPEGENVRRESPPR